jgi:hypothetical protein
VVPAVPVALLPVAELPVVPAAPAEPPVVDCAKATVDMAASMVAVRICLRMMVLLDLIDS